MSKLWIPLVASLLFGWIIGGTIWYKKQFCETSVAANVLPPLPPINWETIAEQPIRPTPPSRFVSANFEFVLGKSRYREILVFCELNTTRFKESDVMTAYLRELKSYLTQHPTAMVAVVAHADPTERRADRLAAERTLAMQDFLMKQGFEMHQLQLRTAHTQSPLEVGKPAKNARIEIKVLQ